MRQGQISKDLDLKISIQNAEYLSETYWDYLMPCEILYQQAICSNFTTSFQARNLICLVVIPHLWTLCNSKNTA